MGDASTSTRSMLNILSRARCERTRGDGLRDKAAIWYREGAGCLESRDKRHPWHHSTWGGTSGLSLPMSLLTQGAGAPNPNHSVTPILGDFCSWWLEARGAGALLSCCNRCPGHLLPRSFLQDRGFSERSPPTQTEPRQRRTHGPVTPNVTFSW